MFKEFFNIYAVVNGVGKVLVLGGVGFLLARMGIVHKRNIHYLNVLLLWVCLPALIFSNISQHFSVNAFPQWWVLPLSAIIMCVIGFVLGSGVAYFFPSRSYDREFTTSCAYQNCGYLPLRDRKSVV